MTDYTIHQTIKSGKIAIYEVSTNLGSVVANVFINTENKYVRASMKMPQVNYKEIKIVIGLIDFVCDLHKCPKYSD